jgi:hypothetical protein
MTRARTHIRLAFVALVWLVLPGRAGEADADKPDPPIGSAKLLLAEDFESTPVGEIPRGFTKTGPLASSMTSPTPARNRYASNRPPTVPAGSPLQAISSPPSAAGIGAGFTSR